MARPLHELQVVRTEQVTPHITRVILGGNGFDGFQASSSTDSYAKLIFLPEEHEGPGPRDIDEAREMRATVRTYTIRSVDAVRREISIDFVVHGDTGVAGPWAGRAQSGDRLYVTDPNGAYSPDPAADWHLFAGDEAAIPAISVALQALPDNARAKVFIEIAGPQDEIEFDTRGDVDIVWVHRGGGADEVGEEQSGDNAPLIEAVRSAEWLPGQVQVFIHGEAQTVMYNLRPYVRKERGVDAKWASSISGYWRRGRTEESFRVWKQELAAAESPAS
ncbi:siderophore-interacting protein [Mycobacterium sp. CBMA271]|uniref:siderophore-interacting protein n=1 Tax=unclassified Mycobacteroides TaxID=2618759 RepID=UPI0012DC5D6A|nr:MULTISPECIES: siderophore-interacting protein [unclassified Mycobacteroides]MUM20002.1 NADPH-dependent ferric siderophore reductase [Mycobacteroides sp. CBMA 326]MUM20176.1 siderophore-interacting protein [Mycobacteroides sp. CBMA 271]